MDPSQIDSESLNAVQSLRSKFEQLASNNHTQQQRLPSNSSAHGDLLSVDPPSPRPRTSSNTTTTPNEPFLRPSSSTSDLKRRPPPPPPRTTKQPSRSSSPNPLPSPLLRPVPVPPSSKASSYSALSKSRPNSVSLPPSNVRLPSVNVKSDDALGSSSFASSRIFTPPESLRIHTTRESSLHSEREPPIPKPAIPPRPYKPSAETPLQTEAQSSWALASSPEQMLVSPSGSHESLQSGDDSEVEATSVGFHTLALPPIPARSSVVSSFGSNGRATMRMQFGNASPNEVTRSEPSSPGPKSLFSNVPAPPPRHRTTLLEVSLPSATSNSLSTSPNAPKSSSLPPPLPSRRTTFAYMEDTPTPVNTPPPPPPATSRPRGRPLLAVPRQAPPELVAGAAAASHSPSVNAERRPIGSSRLPPPPTRTIALHDKLPPARRPSEPSSEEESGDEEDAKVPVGVDSMPDSSSSSRRPPILSFREGHAPPKIYVPAHSGCAAVSGSHVAVAYSHHIKIYDLARSDMPIYALDTKDVGVKEGKVTALEIRPSSAAEDRGCFLWIGTKEGHILEADIRTGSVTAFKNAVHLYPISYMFRFGESMVTMDESGKTNIFSPEVEGRDISLVYTLPRATRTTEKQDFAKFIGGKLWTAARAEHHGATTGLQKVPIIRIFDILNPASTGRSLMPSEHVGPVTSGTVLPTQPGLVYLGHEEGYISIWSLDTGDGYPRCVEVVKVSTSDVICLEGVNDKLWAGSRNGMISAYDVTHKPWIVTNCWNAHPGLPVMKLMVNHYGIEKLDRLCVASVGRDEQLRVWDGLLGLDWVDNELLKSETSFSTFRELSVLIVSWNCDSARPDSLTGDQANITFLSDVLHSVDSPDVIAFGLQEVIDLESRKMTAKNVLLGGKKKDDMGLSDKVTGAYKRWHDRLVSVVRSSMPQNPYTVIHTESLVGLFSCIFIKTAEKHTLDDVAITTIKRGMGGRYGNKGGIVARFVIGDSSICIINCHLAAGQNAVRRRNADAAAVVEEKAVLPVGNHSLGYVGGGDGSMVLDHEIVFFHGDMNYRIDHRRDAIIAAVRAGDFASLVPYDQLIRETKFNRGFRLRGFCEGPLNFAPTYKYDPRSNEYDSSEKHRSPAWCDRILWRTRVGARVRQVHYRRYEANVSDHRPISAAFIVTVKTFQHDARNAVKEKVETSWFNEQGRLLSAASEFYMSQALI